MATRIKINPEVLKWGLTIGDSDEEELHDQFSNLDLWINGEKDPTLAQLQKLSKTLNIPFGYLLLDEPLELEQPLIEYRTLDSEELMNPSNNLLATIDNMEIKQSWMRDFYVQNNYESLPFVGSLKNNNNHNIVVDKIREILHVPIDWQDEMKKRYKSPQPYKYFKNKIQNQRILVFQDGVVDSNTHRKLNIQEFRGFCLIDDYAPLIFINTLDSENGKLFTLIHELVHIFIGTPSLMTGYSADGDYNAIESLCNASAAELLVPLERFEDRWERAIKQNDTLHDAIYRLSSEFSVSKLVIARKALDSKFIEQTIYNEVKADTENQMKLKKKKDNSAGGNYYLTQKTKLDPNFILAINDSVNTGAAPYTDIYKNTHMKRDTFKKLANDVLKEEWEDV